MKHFVTIIQNDSTCACFSYDDKAGAMSKYHSEMAYAMNAGVTTLCTVMNASGGIIANEKYTAPAAEPQDGEAE